MYNTANSTMTLNECTLSGNTAEDPNGGGGGIYNVGAFTLNQCTLWGNTATNLGGGQVGIFNNGGGGTVTVNQCTLSGNHGDAGGGGIYNNGGTITNFNSIVAGNTGFNNDLVGADIYTAGTAIPVCRLKYCPKYP